MKIFIHLLLQKVEFKNRVKRRRTKRTCFGHLLGKHSANYFVYVLTFSLGMNPMIQELLSHFTKRQQSSSSSFKDHAFFMTSYIFVVVLQLLRHVWLFCNLMDCSSPGFSVHGIFQARILEWIVISYSRASSPPRDQTHVSCTAGRFFTTEPPGKPHPPTD